jgi:multidrug efflux pump subunit AcrA (membrane-fusion protein)
MKSLVKSFLVSLIIITIAVVIYIVFSRTGPIISQKEDNIDYPLVETIKLISQENTINIMAYGEVISAKVIKIKYRDKGRIIKVGKNIKNGSLVKKDDLLFEVDSFDIKNDLQDKYLSKKIIALNIKKLDYQIETKLLRRKELIIQRNIVKKQLNKKLANKNKVFSENSIDELRLSLSLKEEKLIDNKELTNSLVMELETYKEEVKKLNNTIARFNNDLKATKVFAPYAGHISQLNMEVGKEISSNEVLAELSASDALEVKFSIGGIDYYKLNKFTNKGIGTNIDIKWMVGNKFYKEKAVINRIDGLINREIAGINLYAGITAQSSNIPLGAFVEINLKQQISSRSILVPLSSVFNNKYIFIVNKGRLKKQKIRIISEEFNGVLIEDDDLSGKNIIVTRLSNMQDNMQVNILTQ